MSSDTRSQAWIHESMLKEFTETAKNAELSIRRPLKNINKENFDSLRLIDCMFEIFERLGFTREEILTCAARLETDPAYDAKLTQLLKYDERFTRRRPGSIAAMKSDAETVALNKELNVQQKEGEKMLKEIRRLRKLVKEQSRVGGDWDLVEKSGDWDLVEKDEGMEDAE